MRNVKLRNVLTVIGIAGLGLFVWLAWEEIVEAAVLLGEFNWLVLLLVIPLQLFNYLLRAWFYQSVLAHFGYKVGLLRLYGMGWAVNFVTLTLPSVGISAATIAGKVLRKNGISGGTAAMVQFTKYGMTYTSFAIVLLAALAAVLLTGETGTVIMQFVGLIAVGIVGLTVLFLYLLYNQRAFDWVVQTMQRSVDWLSRTMRGGKDLIGVERIHKLLRDFYRSFHQVMSRRMYMKQPFLLALAGNVVEVSLLYIFFVAIGFALNPAVVVITYAIATSTGFISIIPGDVGVYELVMVAVLSAAGVPLAVGLSVTVMYRVFAKLLFLPLGFYFYNRYIREV